MHNLPRHWPFLLFFLSGFSGLVYQIVWLRLAFASFGVVTPVISVVLSVFMLGLGLGSWFAGTTVRRWPWSRPVALRAYAAAEFVIGLGGIAVPLLFHWSESVLLPIGETDSATYLAASAAAISLALAPFCLCMGVTFPFMMQAIRAESRQDDSFSFLYLANVLGAVCGVFLTPVALVELFGFRGALALAVLGNWTAAFVSMRLSWGVIGSDAAPAREDLTAEAAAAPVVPVAAADLPESRQNDRLALVVLFTTGLTSIGMEVVWTRAFMPVLTTQVYAFSGLLLTYLVATWCGSFLYRRHLARKRTISNQALLALLSLVAFGQLLQADPRLAISMDWGPQALWLLLGILPYCATLGYLTPKLIDEYSRGEPGPAGHAYAINVLGCILGPLIASYVLLPYTGLQWSGVILALPLWILAAVALRRGFPGVASRGFGPLTELLCWGLAGALGLAAAFVGTSYEELLAARGGKVYRDHTATVIAVETNGHKDMMVNGKYITSLTPATKLMAHLPLAHLAEPPQSSLVICFGMGTTYRSLLSWGIEATAVELVPSVRDAFGFYFDDADEILANPRGRIVIDDGRRFLHRTDQLFDVITLDPPPPVEAAGSSLLYSREFHRLIKTRLNERGILQQWFPGGELKTFQAILRSIVAEFEYVRIFKAIDVSGYHILCSRHPIPLRSAAELTARMPEAARMDLVEWSGELSVEDHFQMLLLNERIPGLLLHSNEHLILTDNRPVNEYYLLHRLFHRLTHGAPVPEI